MKEKRKLPTIIGIFALIIATAAGVLLVQSRQIFRLGASGEIQPKDVRVTNITDSQFTVTWTTGKETSGFINWGKSETFGSTEKDEIAEIGYVHSSTIRGLNPQSSYLFKINIDGIDFDNNGVPWQVQTGPVLNSSEGSDIISGNILTSTGNPASGAIVYISTGAASPVSTITSQNGSWVMSLSSLRNRNLDNVYEVNPTGDVIEISVQAGPLGTSSAQIYAASAKPAPPIILGQVHDFKNLPPSSTDSLPSASLDSPNSSTGASEIKSKFDLSDIEGSTPSAEVTLESTENGEVVNSTTPEFFGEAPAGAVITIKVESPNPQTDEVTADGFGNWEWTPPEDLEPGAHKVTLSWKNEDGILQTITRSFIVQAAEGPAFVSTPSATKKPSPTPSPSSTPKTSTPSASKQATSSAIPDSGTLTPTVLLIIMGMGLVIFAGSVYYMAKEEE